MTTRIPTGHRQPFNGQVDITRYVFCCLGCPWQIQAGYRARSDIGGAQELLHAITYAHREHIEEAHADQPIDAVIDYPDGTTHPAGQVNPDGSGKAALGGTILPDWWVDRG